MSALVGEEWFGISSGICFLGIWEVFFTEFRSIGMLDFSKFLLGIIGFCL